MAENVTNLGAKINSPDPDVEEPTSNLKQCQADLGQLGYNSVAIVLSPHQLVMPEMRWRTYILFHCKLSVAALQEIAITIDAMKADATPFPLDRFMLCNSHPLVDTRLADALAENGAQAATHQRSQVTQKWAERQRRQRGKPVPSRFSDPSYSEKCAWLGTLTPRDLQSLLSVPETCNARIVDVSQNQDRNCLKCDIADVVIPCVTKKSKFFDRTRERLWLGIELCATQGIFMTESEYMQFGNLFATELGGDAYNGPTVLLIYLLVVVALAKDQRAARFDTLSESIGLASAHADLFSSIEGIASHAPSRLSDEPVGPPDAAEGVDVSSASLDADMLAFGALV